MKRKAGTYIAVTMKAQEQGYAVADSAAMFDYAYDNFSRIEVEGGSVLVPNGTDINSLTADTQTGNDSEQKTYYLGDYMVGTATVPLVSQVPDTPAVTEEPATDNSADNDEAENESTDAVTEKKTSHSLLQILLIIMAGMVLLLIILIIALVKKERR